jgi:membrane protease YdiL (CAAX protease family)
VLEASEGDAFVTRHTVALWALCFYAILGATGASISLALSEGRRGVLTTASWVGLEGGLSVLASVGLGAGLAAATIAVTPRLVSRFAWARELHDTLRPVVHGAGGLQLAATAAVSGLAEELFFRGMLVQVAGLFIASLVFGVLHQVKGPGRWIWAGWATVMGLLFGAIFCLTGSLVGPIVAHVAINAVNLRYLRDHAPRKPRHLGGLLGDA